MRGHADLGSQRGRMDSSAACWPSARLFQGRVQASGMMARGALVLFAWAVWLDGHGREPL